jgi:hypothetical protein
MSDVYSAIQALQAQVRNLQAATANAQAAASKTTTTTSGGGSLTMITPVQIVSDSGGGTSWATVSLTSGGVPIGASYVYLQGLVPDIASTSTKGDLNVRQSASGLGPFILATAINADNHTGPMVGCMFCPVSAKNTIDWENETGAAVTISVIGWIS